MEFVTLDNAFFYSFSAYAGSYPPTVVLTYENGEYCDATLEFTEYLIETRDTMRSLLDDPEFVERANKNGVLAGYVAQSIRLGQYREAWQVMLGSYDRNGFWGTETYNEEGELVQQYPDLPSALYAFLQELGYLDASGRPQPAVDRSPVVGDRETF